MIYIYKPYTTSIGITNTANYLIYKDWLIFNLFIPFSVVLIHTYMDYLMYASFQKGRKLGLKCASLKKQT